MRDALLIIDELLKARQKSQKAYQHNPYENGIIDGLTLAKVMITSSLEYKERKDANGQD